MLKKLMVAASAIGASALVFFTQLTVSSGGVVAFESTDTTGLMNGVGNAMTSLFNLIIGVWPIMLTITVVGLAIGLVLGLVNRVKTRR